MIPLLHTEANISNSGSGTIINGYAREWWERYVVLLIPLLLITMAMAYSGPSYPDLMPFFWVWMILVNAVLWYISSRVASHLKAGHYGSVRLDLKGKSIEAQKRRFVSRTIRAGAVMALLGTAQSMFYVSRGDYESASNSLLTYLVASLIFSILFVLVLPDRAAGMEVLLDSYLGIWVTLLIVALIVVGITYFSGFRLRTYAIKGPLSSWPTLLNFAQHEAQKIDKGAIVESVGSEPAYNSEPPYSSQTTAFEVAFVFRRPDATSIRIVLLDTEPPKLQRVESKWDAIILKDGLSLLPDRLSRYAANLSYIKLGPRDAYRLTEQEGWDFAQKVAPGHWPIIRTTTYLQHDWQQRWGVPSGWNVDYTVKTGSDYRSLNLRVDGASGRILARERSPEDLKSTPNPLSVELTPTPFQP